MPLYDFWCKKCDYQFEGFKKINDPPLTCPKCGQEAEVLITCKGRDWFRPGWWEDFDEKPIYVRSKRHLKELCKKYGVYSRAL